MTRPSTSDSKSPKSISSSERRARPSTSRSLGSSRSRSAAVSPSRSANPAAGALAAPATRERTLPRTETDTPPRTTSTPTESPSIMSSTQTVTGTTTESGSRLATSDAYRFSSTLYYPERTTQTPARRTSLIVNATAGPNATPSGSGSSSTSYGAMQNRQAYSYQQSYSQIPYSGDGSQSQSQSHLQAQSSSHSRSSWNMTIAEIPAEASAEADSTSRSSLAGYGSAAPSASVLAADFVPNSDTPTEHGHVEYYTGMHGSAPISGTTAEPSGYRPPSLASYALTPAAQATSWRETVNTYASTSSSAPAWPSSSLTSRGAAQWELPSSLTQEPARTSYSLGPHPPFALSDSSPTHTTSPRSATDTASSSWALVPSATVGRDEGAPSRSSRPYAMRVLSTNTTARPSLTRSALDSSSAPSSSLQVSSFTASGASNASAAAPTSASASTATISRVPEPATSFSLPSYASRSSASPSRLASTVGEPSAPFTGFAANYTQMAGTTASADVVTPSSTGGQQEHTQSPPRHGSETRSPASSRLAYSDSSPGHERHRYEPAAAFQVPIEPSGYAGQALSGNTIEARASPNSSSGVAASGPLSSRRANYSFVGTNTSAFSDPFGVRTDSDPGPSPLALQSSSSAPLLTTPVTIPTAQHYDYSYTSSSSAPGPATGPVTAPAATSGAGSSSGQSTRKRNHPCWMCHKSFDRPSTLRKHLLVHTGEKAYVCNICNRRFGVASNLNRHTRRCIARPVNSAAFHSASASDSAPVAGPSTSATTLTRGMAREQTNPDVRQSERERDGREEQEGEQLPPASATTSTSETSSRNPRRRGRSPVRAPLGGQSINTSMTPESQGSSSAQTSYQLRPAFDSGVSQASGSGQVAVAAASASTSTGDAEAERRPKRRRRAPSPSRWVPASLRTFSLSPVRQRTSTPLPPVSPGYDAATGAYEERDSYATISDENVDPAGEDANAARTRAERLRNFEYAPYHPCGWTGRLPGPAVVGNDVTNYTKSVGGGSGLGGGYSDSNSSGGLRFMFEFSLAAAG